MPYKTKEDLPDAVKKLSPKQQSIWKAAFNSAYHTYNGDETRAFKVAWTAAKRSKKNKKGE